MNKMLIIACAASFAALPAMAADNNMGSDQDTQLKTEGQMNPTAGSGAPSNQEPGTATSDRTPGKVTPTPETQVDRSKSGETSDRTPSNH